MAARPVVLDGVRQQVEHDLREARRVAVHAAQRGQRRVEAHLHLRGLGAPGEVADRLHRELPRVDGLDVQPHAAGLHAGEVEQVADHRQQVRAGVANVADLQQVRGVQRAPRVHLQHRREAQDRVERRAQLVAHVGDELGLGAVGVLGRDARRHGRLGHAALGDVVQHPAAVDLVVAHHHHAGGLGLERRAVGALHGDDAGGVAVDAATRDQLVEARVGGRDEPRATQALDGGLVAAEHRARGRVGGEHVAAHRGLQHRVEVGLVQQAEAPLAAAHRAFGVAVGADVHERHHRAHQLAPEVELRAQAAQQPQHVAVHALHADGHLVHRLARTHHLDQRIVGQRDLGAVLVDQRPVADVQRPVGRLELVEAKDGARLGVGAFHATVGPVHHHAGHHVLHQRAQLAGADAALARPRALARRHHAKDDRPQRREHQRDAERRLHAAPPVGVELRLGHGHEQRHREVVEPHVRAHRDHAAQPAVALHVALGGELVGQQVDAQRVELRLAVHLLGAELARHGVAADQVAVVAHQADGRVRRDGRRAPELLDEVDRHRHRDHRRQLARGIAHRVAHREHPAAVVGRHQRPAQAHVAARAELVQEGLERRVGRHRRKALGRRAVERRRRDDLAVRPHQRDRHGVGVQRGVALEQAARDDQVVEPAVFLEIERQLAQLRLRLDEEAVERLLAEDQRRVELVGLVRAHLLPGRRAVQHGQQHQQRGHEAAEQGQVVALAPGVAVGRALGGRHGRVAFSGFGAAGRRNGARARRSDGRRRLFFGAADTGLKPWPCGEFGTHAVTFVPASSVTNSRRRTWFPVLTAKLHLVRIHIRHNQLEQWTASGRMVCCTAAARP